MNPYLESGTVREFVDQLVDPATPITSEIHPDDEMYRYNLESLRGCRPCAAILYYLKGWQIFSTVREIAAWRWNALSNVRSFLDIGSGWGRVSRFLVRDLPAGRICVADVRPEAVTFQSRAFGVRGLNTTTDPASLDPGERFEYILAASLFSHLPEGRFQGWMRRLVDLLRDGGLLLLSTHGASLLKADSGELLNGIAFFPESEARDFDTSEYGTAYVTPDFVRRVVAEATEGHGRARYFSRGLCGYQDLYLVTRDKEIGRGVLNVTPFPRGEVERSDLSSGRLVLEGWADGGSGPSSLKSVRLTVNNRELATWLPAPSDAPTDQRRWRIDVDRSGVALDDVLIASARNAQALENILAMGTLRPYLAPPSATET